MNIVMLSTKFLPLRVSTSPAHEVRLEKVSALPVVLEFTLQ
jgi:hypothetical protein